MLTTGREGGKDGAGTAWRKAGFERYGDFFVNLYRDGITDARSSLGQEPTVVPCAGDGKLIPQKSRTLPSPSNSIP